MIGIPNAVHICDRCGELAEADGCECCSRIGAAAAETAVTLSSLPRKRVLLAALPKNASRTNVLFRQMLIAELERKGTPFYDGDADRMVVKPRCQVLDGFWRDVLSGFLWTGGILLFVLGILRLLGGGR